MISVEIFNFRKVITIVHVQVHPKDALKDESEDAIIPKIRKLLWHKNNPNNVKYKLIPATILTYTVCALTHTNVLIQCGT